MTREEAKEYILNNPEGYFKRAKATIQGKPSYICPLCGNGSGKDGTGITEDKNNHYKCFKCNEYGDIFHFIAKTEGLDPNSKETFDRAYELYNLSIDNTPASTFKGKNKSIPNIPKTIKAGEDKTDYLEYMKNSHLEATNSDIISNYLLSRGINKGAIKRHNLGYDKDLKGLVIPTENGMYKLRYISDNSKYKYMNSKGGSSLFNSSIIKGEQAEIIYITEGEIDAISVMEAGEGVKAVGLGSISNKNKLIEAMKLQDAGRKNCYILLLDTDDAGIKAGEDLEKTLTNIGYNCVNKASILGEYKDPNEALINQREYFLSSVLKLKNSIIEERKKEYIKLSAGGNLQEFINGISDKANTHYIPTGFETLDNVLDGGLYEGLYIIGAISSLGKTTLVLQMADQIAQQGQDVLIFSLEMSKFELMAKSISRETMIYVLNNGDRFRTHHAKTSRGITTYSRYAGYNIEEKELIKSAIEKYSEYANHIFIYEGIGDISVNEIAEKISFHKNITGKSPVIVIDYLQIIAPMDVRASDKQNIDRSVTELKRISRDYKTPVIGISSFNRSNYDKAVSMTAFKESGAIEYSSDVLIGLQLAGQGENDFNVDEAKKADPRLIEVKILKNRNGRVGNNIKYMYYPLFNYFEEEEAGNINVS